MESFEIYYNNENVIEEISFQGIKDTVAGVTTKAVDATKGAVTDASGKAQEIAGSATEKMADLSTSLGEITTTVKNLPQALSEMGQWTMNAGMVGIGGAFVSQGLGAAMTMLANKLDKERLDLAKRKESQREIMVKSEFEAVFKAGEQIPDDEYMKKLDEISNKWAGKYKIPEPQLFVAAIRKIGEGLKTKYGAIFGAVIAILAFKMGTPFPTFTPGP